MFDLKDLRKIGTEKNVFLFQYQKIKPHTLKGLKTFLGTANANFKKVGTPIRFELFIDQVYDANENVIAERVYLTLKDDKGIFNKLDHGTIQSMIFEYLFHVLGLVESELEQLENE